MGERQPVRAMDREPSHALFSGGGQSVVPTHGEDDQRAALAKLIQRRHRLPSTLPKMRQIIEVCIYDLSYNNQRSRS